MSPSRIRSRSIGGKVPWEHETKIWFDEMDYDCIASGVTISGTCISSVADSNRG